MASLRFWFLLACLSVAVRHINSYASKPGTCNFMNYCRRLRTSGLHPIASNPLMCPDPITCDRSVANFARKPVRRIRLQELPMDRRQLDTGYSSCQFRPHCHRSPLMRSKPARSKEVFKIPVRCDFVAYCAAMKRHFLDPIGSHIGSCPGNIDCNEELEKLAKSKETKIPFQALPTIEPSLCDRGVCREGPQKYNIRLVFIPGPDPDLLPPTCRDLRQCARRAENEEL